MFDFSAVQILLVLGIALLVLGPKRLPDMARSMGRGLRGFRDSLSGNDEPDTLADEPKVALLKEIVVEDETGAPKRAGQPVSVAVTAPTTD